MQTTLSEEQKLNVPKEISTVIKNLDFFHFKDEIDNEVLKVNQEILKSINSNFENWLEYASIGMKDLEQQLNGVLPKINLNSKDVEKQKDYIYRLLSITFPLIYEYNLRFDKPLNPTYQKFKYFVFENIDSFPETIKSDLKFIIFETPSTIYREQFNNLKIKELKKLDEDINKNISTIEEWDSEYEKKLEKVEGLKATLDQYTDAFNFVALYDGFSKLKSRLSYTSWGLVVLMVFLAFGVLTPVILEFSYFSGLIGDGKIDLKNASIAEVLMFTFPVISLTFLMLYFFRVVLHNYKVTMVEKRQVQLRMTLCQFIQDYSKYAKDIKENSDVTLESFERVIFSDLTSSSEKLPTTLDGIDKIASLLKVMKQTG